jgi:hypothetical protein
MNLERAVTLRDCALAVVKAHGAWESVQYGPNSLAYREGALTIAYRSPFQKLPALSAKVVRQAINFGLQPVANLPHGLDIWCNGKVLNIDWSDAGEVAVIGYKPGAWEQELERLGAALIGRADETLTRIFCVSRRSLSY